MGAAALAGADVPGGPNLPGSVDLLAELGPAVGWTLGMEGVAPGLTTVILRLEEDGAEICRVSAHQSHS